MSGYDRVLIAGFVGMMLSGGTAWADAGLGQPASDAEIAAWDVSIGPDGAGLPPGGGTAKDGAAIYEAKCLSCHGEGGASGEGLADPLVSGIGSLTGTQPMKTVGSYWPYATTLFDYTRRAMPFDAPMSLTDDEVYAVSAYILWLNGGIVAEDQVLNAETLPAIKMPNSDGFMSYWPPQN
jgi:mono/diheme cytochrome c family protein